MSHLLEFQHVSYSYHALEGETLALSDIDFSLENEEFLAVVGPSGCGKSTLLNLICNLIQPEQGQILFQGEALGRQSASGIGYMLQKDHLFEWRTIERNIHLGLEIQNKLNQESKSYAERLLKKYGLYEFRHKKPSQLSGGMRQRAAFLRTYLMGNDVALLDEPFSALDAITRTDLRAWYCQMASELDMASVVITHDVDEAVTMANRIYVLEGNPRGGVPSVIAGEVEVPREQALAAADVDDFALTPEYVDCKRRVLELLG